jgi:hypothetical protein
MPTFHLHLLNHHIEADDIEGHDLPDLETARAMALAGIRDFLGHEAMNGKLDFRGRIDIEDDTGTVLQSVPFVEAFEIKGL